MTDANVARAIDEANRKFMTAFGRGDASAVAALYAAGAQVLPPNSDVVTGEAIRAFWQGAMDMGLKDAKLETVDLNVPGGDTAIETGRYTLFLAGGATADAGKYLVVWKNEGGTWKLYQDIWNTSQPRT